MPSVTGLGHVGIHVSDLERARDFYTRILGLQVTAEDRRRGMVFLSAEPEREHHEVLLLAGRQAEPNVKLINQISLRVASLEDLRAFRELFQREGVPIERIVSHGFAVGLYFFDPDGNRLEVYYDTQERWSPPHSEPIDLALPDEALLASVRQVARDKAQAPA